MEKDHSYVREYVQEKQNDNRECLNFVFFYIWISSFLRASTYFFTPKKSGVVLGSRKDHVTYGGWNIRLNLSEKTYFDDSYENLRCFAQFSCKKGLYICSSNKNNLINVPKLQKMMADWLGSTKVMNNIRQSLKKILNKKMDGLKFWRKNFEQGKTAYEWIWKKKLAKNFDLIKFWDFNWKNHLNNSVWKFWIIKNKKCIQSISY